MQHFRNLKAAIPTRRKMGKLAAQRKRELEEASAEARRVKANLHSLKHKGKR